jgi:hypothetical protein
MSLLFSNPDTADYARHWVRTSRTGQAVWFSVLLRYFPSPFLVGVMSSRRDRQNDLTLVMLGDSRVIVLDVAAPRGHKPRKRAVKTPKIVQGAAGRTRRKIRPKTKEATESIATLSDFDVRRSAAFQHICGVRNPESPTIGIIGRGSRFVIFEVSKPGGPEGSDGWDFRYIQLEDVPGNKSASLALPYCIVDQAESLDAALRSIREKALASGFAKT